MKDKSKFSNCVNTMEFYGDNHTYMKVFHPHNNDKFNCSCYFCTNKNFILDILGLIIGKKLLQKLWSYYLGIEKYNEAKLPFN